MAITLLVIGKLRFSPYRQAADEYLKRLRHFVTLNEIEIKSAASPKLSEALIKTRESQQILSLIPKASHVFILDERGKALDSLSFASQMGTIIDSSQDICFAIGGALGHDKLLRERANTVLSLSKMTLPHELARVVLYEQVYRCMTILKNLPYHK